MKKIIINKKKCVRSISRRLRKMVQDEARAVVVLSYDTPYAVYVHEDLTPKNWTKPGTGAKFLEAPARQMANAGELSAIVNVHLKRKRSLSQALLSAGRALLARSREVCPIDTKALYKSSKVRLEGQDQGPLED
jgi:hypothetical protein